MDLHKERKRLLRSVLGTLVLWGASSPALAAEASKPPAPPAALERALERLDPKLGEPERARLVELFSGWDALVAYLPVADLRRITFGEGWLELRFDFGKKKEKVIEIPASKKLFWDAKHKKAVAEKSDAEEIRLRADIRILFDESGIRGLRGGDLSVWSFPKWWELDARTERKTRVEQDSHDRPRVCTDAAGRAVLRDEKPVLLECSRWLVLEVMGERMEVALDCAGA